ncbi:MAG: hypothetical protein J5616_08110 [Bacteroidaceae bacterium]|nr:hypothetical protein [Bacteroidaceae bacterium]
MKRIVLSLEFVDELEDLFDILIEQGYFSYDEYALKYIDDIEQFITSSIYTYPKREAPSLFAKYGKDLQYIAYKKNARTTWYILFEETDSAFFIRHITNNHVSGQYF